MIFKPSSTMWDTWLFAENDIFYLFTLTASEHCEQGYDGITLCRSDDLVHWEELDVVWWKRPEAEWMGTGHTWKIGDTYVLNYSECNNHTQKIRFAISKDLLHWTDLGDDYESRPDERWYQIGHEGCGVVDTRWDTINVVPAEDGSGYIGYLTATANFGPIAKRGVIGCVRSKDGMHFTAAPPASEPNISCQMELGGPAKLGSHWYMAACIHKGVLGERLDSHDNAIGTQYMVSESQQGPFHLPAGSSRLLSGTRRWSYFGRFFSHEGTVLFNHHSCPSLAASGAYEIPGEAVQFAPVKEVREIALGKIALYYWKGNDALYGQPITIPENGFEPIFSGKATSTSWDVKTDTIIGQADGTGAVAICELGEQTDCGIIIDTTITMEAGCQTAGLLLSYAMREVGPFIQHLGCAIIINRDGIVEIGTANCGYGGLPWAFESLDRQANCVEPGPSHQVKLLARSGFFELYIDDRIVQAFSMSERFQGLGLIVEGGTASFSDLIIHRMTLPSIKKENIK